MVCTLPGAAPLILIVVDACCVKALTRTCTVGWPVPVSRTVQSSIPGYSTVNEGCCFKRMGTTPVGIGMLVSSLVQKVVGVGIQTYGVSNITTSGAPAGEQYGVPNTILDVPEK